MLSFLSGTCRWGERRGDLTSQYFFRPFCKQLPPHFQYCNYVMSAWYLKMLMGLWNLRGSYIEFVRQFVVYEHRICKLVFVKNNIYIFYSCSFVLFFFTCAPDDSEFYFTRKENLNGLLTSICTSYTLTAICTAHNVNESVKRAMKAFLTKTQVA